MRRLNSKKRLNKKAQMSVGVVIMVFITALVGVILLDASADEVGRATSTVTATNLSVTVTNATAVSIAGKSWSGLVVYNTTGDLIPATNYTLANNQVVNGVETATLTPDFIVANFGNGWNLSGTFEPVTYVSDSGARAVVNIILIFFALAVAVVTLSPTLRSKVMGM